VGRRPHPPARPRARQLALARRRQPLHRDRLPARRLLARHLDLGDPSHRRQNHRPLVLRRTFHGPDVAQGLGFSPGAKIGYDITKVVNAGFEYYADYGRITSPDTLHNQQQQIFAVTDLNVSPKWEINIGVGIGPTAATDHLIVKGILGRRFDWGHHSAVD
jgi:hypothetical protein